MENLFKKRQDRLHVFESFRNPNAKIAQPKEIPDYVFKTCDHCGENIPYLELQRTHYVCPRCGCHLKISARERIRQLIDEGTFVERDVLVESRNEDHFEGYDEKLKKACELSGVNEVIKDWENGYDSVLGRFFADNGKDLSGGQWQLVSLARAYFKDCEYMVLDEPSAALDPISEDKIFEQLYRLSEGKSSVTISHRLSNTTLADKILVLKDGRIIEQGSHSNLLNQNGEYAHLFNLQASKYL